jgi:hypothetical protein
MVTDFKSIFRFDLLHTYYTSGKSMNFSLFPLKETGEKLRNHQALFRAFENYGRTLILANAAGTTAQQPLALGDSLYFGMKLNTAAFSNMTNEFPLSKKIFLFTNENNLSNPTVATVELERKTITLTGPVINHVIVTNLAVSLQLRKSDGTLLNTMSAAAGSVGKEKSFDLQQMSPGLYTITEVAGTSIVYTYYVDAELNASGVFGIIRIVNQSAFPFIYDGKPTYNISFTAKSNTWKYYVAAPAFSSTDVGTRLSINDAGRTGASAISFTKTYPVPSTDPVAPLLCSDTSKVVLFTSNSPLLWMQSPRKRIELRKSGTAIVSDLPNPDPNKPGTTMYITI